MTYSYFKGFLMVVLFAATLVSCKVTLIAPYDEVVDQKTAALHETLLLHLKEWSRSTPEYEEVVDFYDKAEITLDILIARVKETPKSDILTKVLEKALANIKELRSAHESGLVDKNYIDQVYPDFNEQFGAIQRFQMALKRADNK